MLLKLFLSSIFVPVFSGNPLLGFPIIGFAVALLTLQLVQRATKVLWSGLEEPGEHEVLWTPMALLCIN